MRPNQARAQGGLARAHLALRDPLPARRHRQRALEIPTGLGADHTEDEEADVTTIRTSLADLARQEPLTRTTGSDQ